MVPGITNPLRISRPSLPTPGPNYSITQTSVNTSGRMQLGLRVLWTKGKRARWFYPARH